MGKGTDCINTNPHTRLNYWKKDELIKVQSSHIVQLIDDSCANTTVQSSSDCTTQMTFLPPFRAVNDAFPDNNAVKINAGNSIQVQACDKQGGLHDQYKY